MNFIMKGPDTVAVVACNRKRKYDVEYGIRAKGQYNPLSKLYSSANTEWPKESAGKSAPI